MIVAYFPFFIDIKGRKCLIVGGGNVAARKLKKIKGFEADITVVAPEICDEISGSEIKIIKRKFEDAVAEDAFMVIAATDDRSLNHHIFELCTQNGILINTVDDIENCGFIFPAIVNKNSITAGISTGGECPALAGVLRKAVDKLIDERYLFTADILGRFRAEIKGRFDTENMRNKAMKALLEMCMKADIKPDDNRIYDLLEKIENDSKNRNTQK